MGQSINIEDYDKTKNGYQWEEVSELASKEEKRLKSVNVSAKHTY